MSANGISHLEFKRQRQEAKLAAAAEKRAKDGKPSKLIKGRLLHYLPLVKIIQIK